MQKTGKLHEKKSSTLGLLLKMATLVCFVLILVLFVPGNSIKACASDLTWNTSEGLGLLAGKTVGNGKSFKGEHNNSSYPDNFTIEFKYFDSEGNVQISDVTCNAKKGASFSMKVDLPIEHTEFKYWQVISATNQLAGDNPTVRLVLSPIGKNGEAIFKSATGTAKAGEASKGKTEVASATTEGTTEVSTLDLQSEEEYYYLDPLWEELKEAAKHKEPTTISWNQGNGLPYSVILFLKENPDITLVFSYHYNGNDYQVTIPGNKADTSKYVPWYGPLNLYGKYGK